MASQRLALALALVAFTPMLAGCNFKDFYNQVGTVSITVSPLRTAANSTMNDFQKITIAIFGVTIRQLGSIDPKSFSFPPGQPLIMDMVDKADTRTPIADFKTNLRATSSVTVRVDVVEAIDAAGKSMKICHEGVEIKNSEYPCFFVPETFSYTYDRRGFAPPRGGEVVVVFPLVVKAAELAGKREYYISTPAELIELENHR